MDILRWLEGLRTPAGDFIFDKLTHLGGEIAFMILAISIFWCVNKKWGYYILTVGFFGTILSQFLKLVYRIPRPWILDPNFTIVESARAEATGYSFPSGHTQNAVGTFGGLAACTNKIWLRIVCIALVILVPFSRMYLGVHTPLDVGIAFGAAVILLLVFYPLVMKSDAHPNRMYWLFGAMLVCCIAYICYVNFVLSPADFGTAAEDLANYTEGVKNGWSLTGALLGLLVTYLYDSRAMHFDEKAPILGQLCKIILGLGCVVAIRAGLSWVFGTLFPGQLIWNMPRYFLMVLIAGCVWPHTFPFFQKLGKKKTT